MSAPSDQIPGDSPAFTDLALADAVLKALQDVGYETPSPIQAATIPHLLAGSDVVGQAQTGTGKTAAFALPILSKIDLHVMTPQALVLVPTRELAIQVAEAFQRYATHMKGFHVLPVYGGQSYTPQLHSLRRGVHVVVATPGRAMDHIKRGTLDLSALRHLVLDEADEMLRMGFIDDVEWILEQAPAERQIALFSATMPPQVRRIAQRHLRNPAEVTIRSKTTTASQIRQRYWIVSGMHKLDALTRILEAEPFDAMIVFARTKIATEELSERLAARGFAVEPLNGDIVQAQRERTVARLKSGQIDIVVATDVAARGLDVERISHVVNFDVPYDPESYVHRIGRTGRAGRSGEAILFIAPRERNMLRVIERATRQPIEAMRLPSVEDVNERRVARFNEKLAAAIASGAGQAYLSLIEKFAADNDVPATEIAAALASVLQGTTPLLLDAGRESTESRVPPPRSAGRGSAESAYGDSRSTKFDAKESRGRPARTKSASTGDDAWGASRAGSVATDDEAQEVARTPAARADQGSQRDRAPSDVSEQASSSSERPPKQFASNDEPRSRSRKDATAHDADAPVGWTDEDVRLASPPTAAGEKLNRRDRRARERAEREGTAVPEFSRESPEETPKETSRPRSGGDEFETYRIEVGSDHGVKPNNIVGAIANEAGLQGSRIGRVVIRDDHSFVDLPAGMPKDVFKTLQKVRVGGQQMQISRALKSHVDKLRRERPPGRVGDAPPRSSERKFADRAPRSAGSAGSRFASKAPRSGESKFKGKFKAPKGRR